MSVDVKKYMSQEESAKIEKLEKKLKAERDKLVRKYKEESRFWATVDAREEEVRRYLKEKAEKRAAEGGAKPQQTAERSSADAQKPVPNVEHRAAEQRVTPPVSQQPQASVQQRPQQFQNGGGYRQNG